MNSKVKRIIAIIGLAFMAVFSVSFVLFLFKTDMWNGTVAFLALFSGLGGVISFLVIKLNAQAEKERTELEQPDNDSANSNEEQIVDEEADKTDSVDG